MKFLLYSLLGGLLMLVAVIALYVYAGQSAATGHHGTFLIQSLLNVSLSPTVQKWLFLGFFIAFAIKAPLWPFHTWLPDAAASAQPGAAVLLVGVHGQGRHVRDDPLLPGAVPGRRRTTSRRWSSSLAVIGDPVRGDRGDRPADLKRLIAYTSVSHFGFITLGIFAMTSQGQAGATLYMVNHGFATGALFLLAGFLIARRGSDQIADYGGVQKVAPVLRRAVPDLRPGRAVAARACPPSSASSWCWSARSTRYKVPAMFATAGIILAAIYILWMYQRTMSGPSPRAGGRADGRT